MMNLLVLAGLSALTYYVYIQVKGLRQNLLRAKRSGFQYLILPVFIQDIGWLFTQNLLVPLLDRLPVGWTEKWLPLLIFHRTWNQSYTPFERMGADTFLAVSPGRNVLWTCDPEAIDQVLSRREEFVKPLEAFQMLNIYGPTIAGTDGKQWRHLRKIIGPSFNEKTHQEVWATSLRISDSMVGFWMREAPSGFVSEIYKDTARLALHVLTSVCFGKELEWTEERDGHGKVPPGHQMAYGESFASLLSQIRVIYFTNKTVLKSSPLPMHRKAFNAYNEWLLYMEEMCAEKLKKINLNVQEDSPGVLETLLATESQNNSQPSLSSPEILGNIFVMILAGHETSGNTMSFAMLLLACRPEIQKALQADLDRIFGHRPIGDWSYESDFPRLLSGYTGAVARETLRLFSPIPFLLRTRPDVSLPITLHDTTYTLPERSTVFLNITAAHRNPKYWPEPEPGITTAKRAKSSTMQGESTPYPISSFDPERWLNTDFHAIPGMYLPFSDGSRACLGRRFSMTEICAVLARVFRDFSVELDTDSQLDQRDQEPSKISDDKQMRQKLWSEAKARAEKELSEGVKFIVTLKMTERVGIRFVERGKEKYFDL